LRKEFAMHAAWTAAAAALLGSGPFGGGMTAPMAGPYQTGPVYSDSAYGGVTASGVSNSYGEQLYSFEQQEPWLHGYFQEIPAYGGYYYYRPYNYKHVLSQSQTAAGFGMSPVMPYSQQFWHRYENRANLSPYVNEPGGVPPMPSGPMPVPAGPGMMPNDPGMAPQALPGVGMRAPQPAVQQTILPAEWQAGPVIVPGKPGANGQAPKKADRWGRFAD
jgi:hypothetical protein